MPRSSRGSYTDGEVSSDGLGHSSFYRLLRRSNSIFFPARPFFLERLAGNDVSLLQKGGALGTLETCRELRRDYPDHMPNIGLKMDSSLAFHEMVEMEDSSVFSISPSALNTGFFIFELAVSPEKKHGLQLASDRGAAAPFLFDDASVTLSINT